MNPRNRVCRIGILGAGRIGKLHAANIQRRLPHFRLMAVADPHLDTEWAQAQGIALATHDPEAIFSHPDIDAVLIASPTPLHVEQILAASKAGKAIYCEKPVGLEETEVRAVIEVVEAQDTLLHIGFNRRFDPSFARLAKQVQHGDIGTPQLIRITSRDPAAPPLAYARSSGGMFLDMTIHDFDMARFVMRSEVVEVYASAGVLIAPELEAIGDVDTAIIQLRFANGALGVIDNSRQAVYGYDQRVEVLGSEGMLQAQNCLQHAVHHYTEAHTSHANPLHFFLERYEAAFIAGLEAFYEAWSHKSKAPVTARDGLQAMQIAHAANASLASRQPVALSGAHHG